MQEEINLLKQQIADNKREFDDFKNMMSQQTHNGIDGAPIDIRNISNFIETIKETSGTTQLDKRKITNPKSVFEQMFVYYDSTGPTWKLYIFSDDGTSTNRVWKSVTIA